MKNLQRSFRRQAFFIDCFAMCLSIAGFIVWALWTMLGELLHWLCDRLDKLERKAKALRLFL